MVVDDSQSIGAGDPRPQVGDSVGHALYLHVHKWATV